MHNSGAVRIYSLPSRRGVSSRRSCQLFALPFYLMKTSLTGSSRVCLVNQPRRDVAALPYRVICYSIVPAR